MRKLFLGIPAMFLFLVSTFPASGQSHWPEFDLYPKSEVRFETTIDDGFGGIWNFCYDIGRIFLRRPGNKYPIYFTNWPLYFNEKLKFDERSLPPEAALPVAFYGYLTGLRNDKGSTEVYLWVNQETGEIDEVGFDISLGRSDVMKSLAIPPRNFTVYEDIIKKTVKFKPPHGIFDSVDKHRYGSNIKPENGIRYKIDIKFPAPAEGEPDFISNL